MKTSHRTVLALVLVTLVVIALGPAVGQARAAARSIVDFRVAHVPYAQRPALITEIATNLRAKQLRLSISWPAAEASRGVFNDAYLADLKSTVDLAVAANVKVIMTICYTPKWASNSALWKSPPPGIKKGYHAFYDMSRAALPDFQAFAQHCAAYFGTSVAAWECWNEPNLWNYMYPQRTTRDANYAVRLYGAMLRKFHDGIKAGNPSALVVAGATGPFGMNDRWRTSPQRWANQIRVFRLGAFFDVYSHHPYMIGGTANTAPEAMPRDPKHTIGMGNISVLLRKFAHKPFYLTEYGYNTAPSTVFGGQIVSPILQADYLRRAYIRANHYPQIKYLSWFMVRDDSPSGRSNDLLGVYTGLRSINGAIKRSYYSFAGGNSCSLTTPTSVRLGAIFKLSGYVLSKPNGPIVGARVEIQRRAPGVTKWTTITAKKTTTAGYFEASVRQFKRTFSYRALFRGVVWSSAHKVVAN